VSPSIKISNFFIGSQSLPTFAMVKATTPEAQPMADTTEALEGTRLEVQSSLSPDADTHMSTAFRVEDDQNKIQNSTTPFLPSFHKALYDYVPTEDGELPLRQGDLIECLDRSRRHWFRGRIYSGRPEERIGEYPDNYVSNIHPTDPAFHDALAKIIDIAYQARPRCLDKSKNGSPHGYNTPPGKPARDGSTHPEKQTSAHGERFNWGNLGKTASVDGDINIPTTEAVFCMNYVRGNCREGNKCSFSHDSYLAHLGICEKFATGTCTNVTCRLPHLRYSYPEGRDKSGVDAPIDVLRITSMPQPHQLIKTESFKPGYFARQAANMQPVLAVRDLPMTSVHYLPDEPNTDEASSKYRSGSITHDIRQPISVPMAQVHENRQHTPPIPSQSFNDKTDIQDDEVDMQARSHQLRSELFDAGKADLFYTLTRSKDSTQPKTAVLNIAALQHMSLHQLQYDISYYVGSMYRTSEFNMEIQGLAPLAELLNSYCQSSHTVLKNVWYLILRRRHYTQPRLHEAMRHAWLRGRPLSHEILSRSRA
jgi:hypothetical protein